MVDDSKEQENEEPKGKPKIITSLDGNVLEDEFFKNFDKVDDGLDGLDFSKLKVDDNAEDILDVVANSSIQLTPNTDQTDIKSVPLKTTKALKNNKERDMTNKKLESLGFSSDDPSAKQFAEIWEQMGTPDASEYKLMVLRLEPATIKGVRISGYLDTFHLPTTIPDIIEAIGQKYGGGKYQIRIVDGAGKYVKSKTFEIAGLPKVPQQDAPPAAAAAEPEKKEETTSSSKDEEWEDDDEDFDPTPRRSLRPRMGYPSYPSHDDFSSPQFPPYPGLRRRPSMPGYKDDVDDKISKLESKMESSIDKLANAVTASQQQKNNSFLNPEMLKYLAPVFASWVESKSSEKNANHSTFTDMNQQIVSLMQGMQDLVRMSDKSKEDISEKERSERERYRKEMIDQQHQMQLQFMQQQQASEERFNKMMLQTKESLESKHQIQTSLDNKLRMEFEKHREEARERELKLMLESKEREERLREETRKREEEARRRDFEIREQMRLEKEKFYEEMRRRDEDARQRELERIEQMRIKEIEALTSSKAKELEIMERIRSMDGQKADYSQKLIEQVYNNNLGQRDSQLQLEMAIAKMTNDSEQKFLQQKSQIEIERMKHATQMQMMKMKQDLNTLELNKSEEDPVDAALTKYLKHKLQIDMVKELNMDYDDDDLPGNSLGGVLKGLLKEGASAINPLLSQILMPGASNAPAPGRPIAQQPVVNRPVTPTTNPSPKPTPAQNRVQPESEVIDEEEDYVDVESQEEHYEDEDTEADMMEQIPIVAGFFEYLKQTIETRSATPAEAAEEARQRLAPQIIEYICGESSANIIGELEPLLVSYNPEFVVFFAQPEVLQWMDQMLAILAGRVAPEAEPETAKDAPDPKSEPASEAKDTESEAATKKKRGRPKTRKKEEASKS